MVAAKIRNKRRGIDEPLAYSIQILLFQTVLIVRGGGL